MKTRIIMNLESADKLTGLNDKLLEGYPLNFVLRLGGIDRGARKPVQEAKRPQSLKIHKLATTKINYYVR